MSALNGTAHSQTINAADKTLESLDRPSNGSQPVAAHSPGGYRPTTEPVWLGHASPKPKSRALGATLFGQVDDAFDSKSIKIGEETPYARRERIKEEAKVQKELEEKAEQERKQKEEEEVERRRKEEEMEKLEKENQKQKSLDTNSIAIGEDEKDLPKMLIRGGRVVNDDQSFVADVYVVGKKIKHIGTELQVQEDVKILDAQNCFIMPGGIDTNTQFDVSRGGIRTAHGFYEGSKAAIAGGTTTIVDCVPLEDVKLEGYEQSEDKLIKSFELRRQLADSSICCDFALCVEVSEWNECVENSMEILAREKGVSCFRVSLSSLSDSSLYQFFKKCSELGAIAQVIPKSTQLNKQLENDVFKQGITGPEGFLLSHPEELEALEVNRAILLADQAGAALYVGSLTGKLSAELVSRYQRKGKSVFGDVCCASLTQSSPQSPYEDNNWLHAASHVTEPPLRANVASTLINHLAVGGLQTVGSSHCVFSAEQKAMGKDDFRLIPRGVSGEAERLAVVWSETVVNGGVDPSRFVSITSSNAAKLFNIYPTKGRVAVGSDADLIIWDPHGTTEASTDGCLSSTNVFNGRTFNGSVRAVIYAGCLSGENESEISKGQGQYISTVCNSEYAYGRIRSRQQASRQHYLPIARDLEKLSMSSDISRSNGSRSDIDVAAGTRKVKNNDGSGDDHVNKFHCRPATSSGGRNMQDTTFSLSGTSYCARLDDKPGKKGCGYKVNQPPGGSTTQLW